MGKMRAKIKHPEETGTVRQHGAHFIYGGPSAEKMIVFYIELYGESSAYYLAARLQKEHWDVHVMPTGSSWVLLAKAVLTPDHQTITDLCDYLSDLSEFYGGSFKRWELDTYH
ncbi:ribonuclease E inhibitor RraB [Natronogracilivirga saccharolytica]|uniref:Ribonuclease E inhibitor RraB n=1 Tax=Natronogracilivirga saccharolytica TaxID=2812953 RepID=A0A8J7RIT4_9BACT|nr:ribonuclease E inhibitor RraB [Natronogracilivirga saccharolytica]MBP3192550.1 ribonuclease E inhibitor RraB [Natronogracilivirga saccharolytica]